MGVIIQVSYASRPLTETELEVAEAYGQHAAWNYSNAVTAFCINSEGLEGVYEDEVRLPGITGYTCWCTVIWKLNTTFQV